MASSPVIAERERGVCEPLQARLAPERVNDLTALFKLLADPIRVQIVASLRDADEQVCACDCTAAFEVSQPTMSHHLAKLRDAGVLVATRKGTWMYYRLRPNLPAAARRIIDAL